METQPPRENSAHLEERVAEMQADLLEVKQLLQQLAKVINDKFSLTDQPNHRYIYERGFDNQEKNPKGDSAMPNTKPKPSDRPNHIPFIEEGGSATCSRCEHTWIPFVRRPKQCPACRQPWYKPKAWVRNKSLVGQIEFADGAKENPD